MTRIPGLDPPPYTPKRTNMLSLEKEIPSVSPPAGPDFQDPEPIPEDLNGDMVVDVTDLLIVIGAWGDCSKYTLPNITGACCMESAICLERYEVACEVLLGTYFGDNTTCDSVECQSP